MKVKHTVNAETFVKAYLECDSTKDLAKTLGMDWQTTIARIAALRKRGVKLPKMVHGNNQRMDVDALNNIIKAHETGTVDLNCTVKV